MLLSKKNLKSQYDMEYLKQTEPYSYYIKTNGETESNKIIDKEGEHANVPLVCIIKEEEKLISEDDRYRVYEFGNYFLYESKIGFSSPEERAKLVQEAEKLNADLIYSDEDHITCDGKRHTPFYKPGFGIDTYKYFDYISDFYAVKKEKSKLDMVCLDKISHVTKTLFHCKCEENQDIINEIHDINNDSYLTDEIYYREGSQDEGKDRISVIIPSKDNPNLISSVLNGLKTSKIKSGINALEVVIIDNGSTTGHKEQITGVIKEYSSDLIIQYFYEPSEFNFSEMCNRGAEESKGEYLLFLNDDIEITDELFLFKLLYFAKMDHIGAVGCKLLYPGENRAIQHTGITCLKYAGPSHKLSTFEDVKPYYFGRNRGVHDVLAVTGACLMVSREKFFKNGCFHGKMKVGYNDVDLCISLYENGLLNVVNNDCTLVHHESISRGSDAASEKKLLRLDKERELLYERHPWVIEKGDPFYNINLAEDFLDYRVNVIPDFERRNLVSMENKDVLKKAGSLLKKASVSSGFVSKNLFMNLERIQKNRQYLEISGWAVVNKIQEFLFDTYVVVFDKTGNPHVFETSPVRRQDLPSVFPEAEYCELSGIMSRIPLEGVGLGENAGANDTGACANSDDAQNRDTNSSNSNNNKISQDTIMNSLEFGVLMINKQTGKKYYAGYNKSDI